MTFYIRKSMLEAYVRCPLMAYRKFILYADEQPTLSQFAALGSRFHEFANVFFDVASEYDPRHWERLIPSSFNVEEQRWVRNFIRFERRRWEQLKASGRLDEWYPVERELHLTSSSLGIDGTIDRIDWYCREDNTVVIVEYKCTLSMDYTSLRRQLHFYKLLYEHADQPTIGTVVGIACINPRLDVVWFEYVNPYSERAVMKWIERIRQSMRENVWPKTQNEYVCLFCDVPCRGDEDVEDSC